MGNNLVDGRGRILLPKHIREELGLRPGKAIRIEVRDGNAIIKPTNNQAIKELKGIIKNNDIDPLQLKKMWKA